MNYLIDIIKFLKEYNFQWKDWKLSSQIKVDDGLKMALISYDDFDDINIECKSLKSQSIDICDVEVGAIVDVMVELPRNNDVFVAKDINDFVNHSSLIKNRNNYVIFSDHFFSWKDDYKENDKIFAYVNVFNFISLCLENDVVEHHHSVNNLVLFYQNSKLKISCEINARCLNREVGINFNRIIEKFNSDKHKSDRVHMLRSALYKTMSNCKESKRLIHLINKSTSFVKIFEQNYDLFMSEFCFQSEKDKIFESKREFLSKLSQLLSGIQGKILAIPLSLVLILGQMKNNPQDSPLLVNSLILVSSIVFTIIMFVLLFSQLTSISAIKQEVESKKSRFELELADLYTEVEVAFSSVLKQCLYNKIFISFLLVIVSAGLIGTIVTYIVLTPEVREFSLPYYEYIINKFGWVKTVSTWSSEVVKIKM